MPLFGAIKVFTDADYKGKSKVFASVNVPNLKDVGIGNKYNDQISSIKVDKNIEVTVYEHANYEGKSMTFTSDVKNLKDTGFNDAISSLKIKNKAIEERRQERDERKESRKDTRDKILQKIKGVFPGAAVARGAFLALLRINAMGLASRLKAAQNAGDAGNADAKKSYEDVKAIYYKFGGSRVKLQDVVDKGSKAKPLVINKKKFEEKLYSADGITGNYHYATGIEETAALITASAPILITVINKIGKPDELDEEMYAEVAAYGQEGYGDFINDVNSEGFAPEDQRDNDASFTVEESTGLPIWAWSLIAVTGLALVGGLIYYFAKKD